MSGLVGMMLMGAASAVGRDPRRGCETGVRDNDWMGLRTAYGYQYGGTQAGQEKSEYSFGGFIKETLIGGITGGLASTAFYGAGKAIQALVGSIRSNKSVSNVRNRVEEPVTPTEKTLDMALDSETYAYAVADKYGINLRGSGQDISIKYNPNIRTGTYGLTTKSNPNVIEIGPNALMSEAELANTIAHELNHPRINRVMLWLTTYLEVDKCGKMMIE